MPRELRLRRHPRLRGLDAGRPGRAGPASRPGHLAARPARRPGAAGGRPPVAARGRRLGLDVVADRRHQRARGRAQARGRRGRGPGGGRLRADPARRRCSTPCPVPERPRARCCPPTGGRRPSSGRSGRARPRRASASCAWSPGSGRGSLGSADLALDRPAGRRRLRGARPGPPGRAGGRPGARRARATAPSRGPSRQGTPSLRRQAEPPPTGCSTWRAPRELSTTRCGSLSPRSVPAPASGGVRVQGVAHLALRAGAGLDAPPAGAVAVAGSPGPRAGGRWPAVRAAAREGVARDR